MKDGALTLSLTPHLAALPAIPHLFNYVAHTVTPTPHSHSTHPTLALIVPTAPLPTLWQQAVLRAILGYFTNAPLKDIPTLEVPLHTLIELRPRPDGTMAIEMIPARVSVDGSVGCGEGWR